ncbi:MAG: branched-chain amino acid ABC transporter substrate-binding protein [Chloroflexi bacterium]|nr:branched-chain amino acid ABC transporter substrate-binding protein [Chloroflexota bacterium]
MRLSTRWVRVSWLLVLMLAMALTVVACGSSDDEATGTPVATGTAVAGGATATVAPPESGYPVITVGAGEPIKIGISTILTGDLQALGIPIAQAAELAGKDVTIEGHAITFERKDDQCSSEGGTSAAQQLIDAGVVGVVGPVCSSSVIASQPLYEEAGITTISPSSTAVASTAPAGRAPYATFFRVTYNDAIQGPALAKFASETLTAAKVYVVFFNDAYGQGLKDEFEKAYTGEVLGSEGFEKGATDFSSIVTNIEQAKPDAVFFSGFFGEAVPFITQLRESGQTMPFLSADGVRDEQFVTLAGAAAEGAYLSLPSPTLSGDVYTTFKTGYLAAYGKEADTSPFTAESYDAASVLIAALKQVAEVDGATLKIDLGKLRDAIAASDLTGAIGRIAFDEKGDNAGGETPVSFFIVKDGQFVPFEG